MLFDFRFRSATDFIGIRVVVKQMKNEMRDITFTISYLNGGIAKVILP